MLEIRKIATLQEEVLHDLRPLSKPFRHVIVYPAMLRQIGRQWGRGVEETRAQ